MPVANGKTNNIVVFKNIDLKCFNDKEVKDAIYLKNKIKICLAGRPTIILLKMRQPL